MRTGSMVREQVKTSRRTLIFGVSLVIGLAMMLYVRQWPPDRKMLVQQTTTCVIFVKTCSTVNDCFSRIC